ncbi:MAG: DUF669 domain-containing protein [Anaerotignum sp.]|nr:DUF669 domain-containing protein [Anaerotignum sp.]
MSDAVERELGWNDTIEKDSDFILLPEGDYDFKVVKFERGRHQGSEKLPPCNKAILTLEIDSAEGTVSITHNLFLHSKTETMLSAFFSAIGQKKKNEKVSMNWNAVTGARGRCKVYQDIWKGEDGVERKSNKIKKFYDAANHAPSTSTKTAANPAPQQQVSYTAGRF